ncbi:MAG: hypothetical protein MZV63_26605 [Marinilabiliales bacterium]|nr:hypothetical protein [Marinilabiliales bacterium]
MNTGGPDTKFTYTIELAENIYPEELRIPPMILQPYLENSIWHGLANRPGRDGRLWVSIKWEKRKLCITIEDNGIGREASRIINEHKPQKKGYRSVARINIADRIKLYNELYKSEITTETTDLTEDGKALGIRVIICIPENTFDNKYPEEN